MLKQLDGARSLVRVAIETLLEEVDTSVTELLLGRQLWWVTLGNVVHDGPLIIHGSPRAATGSHLEDYAAERPYVDSAVTPCASTSNDFG